MKKRIFILCLAICLLFTLSSVCAGDVNDTAIASGDADQTADSEILSAEASDDAAGVSSDDNVISSENRDWYVNASAADGGDGSISTPYNSFKSVLNNVDLQDGDSVYFAGGENYAGENNVNLDINKQLNLLKYGSGDAIFDAEKNSRIFKIIASCINITGLTFINGNADYGAAIYFSYGISNSNIDATYINNNATHDGGANYFFSTVSNSNITGTYINNTAEFGGGNSFNDAFSNSNIAGTYNCNTANHGAANYLNWEVSNSNIGGAYNNNTAFLGGANLFNSAVSNSNITGAYDSNSAESNGGANYFYSSVSGSNIMGMYANNTAEYEGGANYFNLEVSNSNITGTYTGNRVNGPGSFDGGAANYFNDAVSGSNITGMYAHNAATYGGAIRFDKDIANSNIQGTYINNTAECGGAIYFRGASKNVEITGIYINNTATYGAVMEFMDNLTDVTISNAIFLNNRYDETIGIISAEKTGAAARNNWFGNNATNYESMPKTAGIQMDSWLFLNATNNQNNITFFLVSYDGTATGEYDNTLLSEINLTVTTTGGSIDKSVAGLNETVRFSPAESGISRVTAQMEGASQTVEVKTGDFDILQAIISNATSSLINLTRNYTYNEWDNMTEGVLIDRPVTINGNGFTIDAKGKSRIFKVTAGSINITNITFKNGNAENGGAIYFENIISNSNINATYINNNASHSGGANFFYEDLSNVNLTGNFINNSARMYGGANHFQNHLSNVVLAGNFINNSVSLLYGGANYILGDLTNVALMGNFINNSATDAGANYIGGELENVNMTCNFINNSAKRDGGANYFFNKFRNVNMTCNFINNSAGNKSGANFFERELRNVVITGNYINNTGMDVIRISNSVSGNVIRDAVFINNAPIVVESGSVSAIDVWFGNNATNYDVKPDAGNGVVLSKWLFLNATAPDAIFAADTINIVFKLSSYDGENASEYDNSRLLPVNLTITSTSGSVSPEIAGLGENITYTPESSGRGTVTATVENVFCVIEFDIAKSNPDLSVGSQETTYSESVILTVSYNAIATGKVNITLNGKSGNYTFTNLELNTTILLAGTINAGDYNVTVAYSGDGRFNDANATANLTVKKMGTGFSANAVTATYNANKNLVITLKDAKGNAITGASVTVDLNGVKTYVTDKNGQITINVAKLVPKAYAAKIAFAGNDNYIASSADVKVTVNKAKSKITAKKKTFKKAKKIKKYTITLKSGKTAIKKVKVTLKIKGKTYKAKTNAKGKATFKIKKLTKKGTFKAVIKFKGNKYYKAVTKKVKIKIK